MGTKLQKRMRPVLARLLESMRKRVKVGVGVQGPGEGGKRSLGILAGNLGLVLPGAGKTLPLGFTKLSWIPPPTTRLLLSPARAFKWGGSFAQVCSAHPAGHC